MGSITVELTSAEPALLLRKLLQAGIDLWDIGEITGLTVRLTMSRSHLILLRQICKRNGASVRILYSKGLQRLLRKMIGRPILMMGCVTMLVLTLYLPSRILFIEVHGAGSVPADQILRNAERCGIYLGAERVEIRSERVKNALLEAMPELQWVGINTYGCRAVISVRQRTEIEQNNPSCGISSLVALRDGVIREMTVLQGNGVCKLGQSVIKGQVLISGYTDLGICLQGTHAKGEVFAETRRTLGVITPSKTLKRGEEIRRDKKYSVIFGNFRINFFKGSGISDTTCDKMYAYHYITLPGGFRLPFALVVEENCWNDTESADVDKTDAAPLLTDCAEKYLNRQMIAGRIDQRCELITTLEGAYYQVGQYACYEMIGTSRPEEDLGTNEIGRTNGERGAS